jgi:hypothetical protein
MAATPSIKLICEFTYRGGVQQFSNRFHFSGGTPANDAAWAALSLDLRDHADGGVRKGYIGCIPAHVTIVKALGYAAGSDIAAWSEDLSEAGERTSTTFRCSGDSALLMRWLTAARSSKGHPIYLMSYIHGVQHESGNGDNLNTGDVTSAERFVERWWNGGFSDGTNTYHRAGPNGATAVSGVVDPFVRHRDFPT